MDRPAGFRERSSPPAVPAARNRSSAPRASRRELRRLLAGFAQVQIIGEASDVDEARQSIEALSPDIVFLDIHLPDISGIELLKEILAVDPRACVIMISADSVRSNVLETKAIGAKWFLTKPVTQEKIAEALRKSPAFRNV